MGTSFELDDLDNASAQTDDVLAAAATISAPGAPAAHAAAARPSRAAPAAFEAPPTPRGRRRSGFWPGVVFALLAVIGLRYLWTWAEPRAICRRFNIRPEPAASATPGRSRRPRGGGTAAPPGAQARIRDGGAGRRPAERCRTGAKPDEQAVPRREGRPWRPGTDAARPDATAAGGGEGRGAAPAARERADRKAGGSGGRQGDKKQEAEEPDEDALLRDAVPNAETAVIGEDEAEAAGHPGRQGGRRRAAGRRAAKADTAVLHLTSAPGGAIVKTKARVLGRTPINLHFKAGNTYEIVFVKRGYQPTTRRVAVAGTKDRKIAVKLKKRADVQTASFFHPHR